MEINKIHEVKNIEKQSINKLKSTENDGKEKRGKERKKEHSVTDITNANIKETEKEERRK